MTVYLDHAASTPVDPQVAAAMAEVLGDRELQANPGALHRQGTRAHERIEQARVQVARLIGATAAEIIWTSGATEANNLALIGAARFRARRGRHLITSRAEHASVVAAARHLEREGFSVTWLGTDPLGVIDPGTVAAAMRPDTTLVSVMLVNNETGVVQDVAAMGALCRQRGVLFHVDAVQAAGREPIDVQAIGADLLSLSAHKMHGPKGIGALFLCRERVARIDPLLHGGDQERGLRPGTLATHQCVGMGMAAALALERGPVERAAVQALRDQLWAVLREIPGVHLNGHPERRACHILNVSIAGVEGESLMFALAGLAVSQGSSCTAGRGDPSAVLRAMGRGESLARSSVRFSFGRTNTQADVAAAADAVRRAVAHLRRIAPGGGLAERS